MFSKSQRLVRGSWVGREAELSRPMSNSLRSHTGLKYNCLLSGSYCSLNDSSTMNNKCDVLNTTSSRSTVYETATSSSDENKTGLSLFHFFSLTLNLTPTALFAVFTQRIEGSFAGALKLELAAAFVCLASQSLQTLIVPSQTSTAVSIVSGRGPGLTNIRAAIS
jgi:hypothetical protein